MGLYNFVISNTDVTVDLPRNTFVGALFGSSAEEIRNSVRGRMGRAFKDCGVKGPILVTVGDQEWTWGTITV